MRPDIHLHIGRLVIDGVPADGLDPQRLSADVRSALEQLLANRGLDARLTAGGSWTCVRGGELGGKLGGELGGTDHPTGLGEQIAHAVHDGLSGRKGARS